MSPDAPPWLAPLLERRGRVVRSFGDRRDSGTTVLGLEKGDGARVVVKAAPGSAASAVEVLRNAARFHDAVQHPAIAAVLEVADLADGGVALIEAWAPGDPVHDPFDPQVADRAATGSTWSRVLALPVPVRVAVVAELLAAHVAVAAQGFVAVDLYDGCLLVDPVAGSVHLIDLDHYRPGPYVLDVERQLGSRSSMAPEEWVRGSVIDERATVFTLGRLAHLLLGGERHGPVDPARWPAPAGAHRLAALVQATAPNPDDRFPTVAALAAAWDGA